MAMLIKDIPFLGKYYEELMVKFCENVSPETPCIQLDGEFSGTLFVKVRGGSVKGFYFDSQIEHEIFRLEITSDNNSDFMLNIELEVCVYHDEEEDFNEFGIEEHKKPEKFHKLVYWLMTKIVERYPFLKSNTD